MAFVGVDYAGTVVKDLDRSIYFYRDVLGMPMQGELSPRFCRHEFERGVGLREVRSANAICTYARNTSSSSLSTATGPRIAP